MRESLWTQLSTPPRFKRTASVGRKIIQGGSKPGWVSSQARSRSQSSLDRRSSKQSAGPEAFRIIIDRPDASPQSLQDQRSSLPTLEVPIPHYRLGTPRFSTRGTAFLHNSSYARSSMNDDAESSIYSAADFDRLYPVADVLETRSILSRRHSHTSPQPYALQITSIQPNTQGSIDGPTPVLQRSNEPITPAVYDSLVKNGNDPAVVRYSPKTGEIIAASPARLIAQITSENFLDYELLSDFFLTVRAYLTTKDLLSYLLARFEWAISRFDDNGRVIRVRAFAAIRHWILNYFPYDFVLDWDLRVQFCDQINRLARNVRDRPDRGASDLKLISDLKKCWNGRCTLCWEQSLKPSDGYHDGDITPGGVPGSRDSQLSHASQLRSRIASIDPPVAAHGSSKEVESTTMKDWQKGVAQASTEAIQKLHRHSSVATALTLPVSPISEQSIQAMSCSIPAGAFIRKIPQIHTISANQIFAAPKVKRVCPPASSAQLGEKASRPKTGHKRSGSFSDAARDNRAPLSSERDIQSEEFVAAAYPYSGDLIRGNVIGPPSPFLPMLAPTTQAPEFSSINSSSQDTIRDRANASPNPAMRTLLGNIRRALSSKNNDLHVSSVPSSSLASGRKTAVGKPFTPEKGYKTQENLDSRGNVRTDILASWVADAFQRAMESLVKDDAGDMGTIGIALGQERVQRPPDAEQPLYEHHYTDEHPRPETTRRSHSGLTNGSQSIVIVDDTGLDIPEMPAIDRQFLSEPQPRLVVQRSTSTNRSVIPRSTSPPGNHLPGLEDCIVFPSLEAAGVQNCLSEPSNKSTQDIFIQKKATEQAPREVSCAPTGMSKRPSTRGNVSLRSSDIRGHEGESATYTTTATDSAPGSSNGFSSRAPKRMLRRRPGGDLKAYQNVQDLQAPARPKSTGSITTYTDSVSTSGLVISASRFGKSGSVCRTSMNPRIIHPNSTNRADGRPSLVRTHSSQPALRPSFEAAVAEFARIPDDEEGGIEATLLKLEGRYQRSPLEPALTKGSKKLAEGQGPDMIEATEARISVEKKKHRHEHVVENVAPEVSSLETTSVHLAAKNGDRKPDAGLKPTAARDDVTSVLYTDSEDSYDSTPLLERGAMGRSPNGEHSIGQAPEAPMPKPLFLKNLGVDQWRGAGSPSPHNLLPENASFETMRRASSIPTTTDSFLLDEDEFLSDLSSDLSTEDAEQEPVGLQTSRQETTLLHMRHHPPSPPMTIENALSITSQANQANETRKPPTPEASPVSQNKGPSTPKTIRALGPPKPPPVPKPPEMKHLPYILAYDAKVIAQQLTIIEKDCLSEIDWRDLVDMQWHNSAPTVTNWVNYLKEEDPKGIDIVTARFNIMVKWALSEIVLTENIEERASCIIKYIHVAKQARKIHNYSTLMQITIALTSVDCTRLTKTWELVPPTEKMMLHELDSLVTPKRNFHNLRLEMETVNAEAGCIPVVGQYRSEITSPILANKLASAIHP